MRHVVEHGGPVTQITVEEELKEFPDDLSEIGLRADVTSIPDLARFTKLEKLRICSNQLDSISSIPNATLVELNLRYNAITEIRGMDALVNLEHLDIGNNRLTRIQ
ncbi:protein phosphatase PP1 regulatory subunit Sds22, partial [Aphelenchoides avenae]